MCNRPTAPAARPRPARAFTLVELLVVIGVIVILATMLIPAVIKARNLAYAAKSQARIEELGNGARMYFRDNMNLYPGQLYAGSVMGSLSGTDTTHATGSQMLAASLFGFSYATATAGNTTSLSGTTLRTSENLVDANAYACYASLANGDLLPLPGLRPDWRGGPLNVCPGTIADRFPSRGVNTTSQLVPIGPGAICYYPAEQMSHLRQYADNTGWNPACNAVYTEYLSDQCNTSVPGNNGEGFWDGTGFTNYTNKSPHLSWQQVIANPAFGSVSDPNSTGTPWHASEFLLIAPGVDRMFGTIDDVTNWGGNH